MTSLAERLKFALAQAGKKAPALARHCKVSPPAVYLWLSSDSQTMKAQHVFDAARFLNVSPEWLATGRVPPTPAEMSEEALSIAAAFERLTLDQRAMTRSFIDGQLALSGKKKGERESARPQQTAPAKIGYAIDLEYMARLQAEVARMDMQIARATSASKRKHFEQLREKCILQHLRRESEREQRDQLIAEKQARRVIERVQKQRPQNTR